MPGRAAHPRRDNSLEIAASNGGNRVLRSPYLTLGHVLIIESVDVTGARNGLPWNAWIPTMISRQRITAKCFCRSAENVA
jgi:hypothetical protein